jgi:CMP/dCMP kinase
MSGLVVSLDGPGSSGKSTVGAAAAAHVGYRFCDTGVLYRGLAWLAVDRGVDGADEPELIELIDQLQLVADEQGRYVRLMVDGQEVTDQLHSAEVDRRVSQVARLAGVRAALLPVQRSLAVDGGMIMAGRDIGTVVLPDADLKVYLQVSIEERARRRAAERGLHDDPAELAVIEQDLRRRDGIDSTREVAPLRIPEGALVIETEGNTLEQTVAAVVAAIRVAEEDAAQSEQL